MADNTELSAASGGDVIATDDIAGVKHQQVKIEWGVDGTATPTSAANPLPVIQTGTPGLPTGAATSAKQPALGIAGTSSADVITVQGRAAMTPVLTDGSATTQPISHAALTELAAAINSDKVDVNIASGAAAGTEYTEDAAAAANPVGGALILVREDGRAGSLTTADGDNVAARGNNKGEMYVKTTDSDALLTTIDTDTGNISTKIDTVAGAVAGTEMQVDVITMPTTTVQATDLDVRPLVNTDVVTAELSATDNAVLDAIAASTAGIDTDTSTIIGHVDGIETLIGTTNTNTGGSATSLAIIDDWDESDRAKVNPIVGQAGVAAGTGTDGATVQRVSLATNVGLPAGTNAVGKLLPPDIDVTAHTNYAKKYYTNAGAVTDGIVWSPAAGKRWHVVSMFINVSAAATVTLEDDKAGGDEAVMKMELAANSGTVINFSEKYPFASGEDAADLLVTTSAGNIYITVTGYEI